MHVDTRRYEDDRDEGEWFLYTGSGGRDLSGNKRTNKVQSFDQKFESMNAALKVSCVKGLPVRVVRSFKVRRRIARNNHIGVARVCHWRACRHVCWC